MVSIVGGKLTTYRLMAQDTVDHIARNWGDQTPRTGITAHLSLDGSEDWESAVVDMESKAVEYGLREDTLRRLSLYGSELSAILDIMDKEPQVRGRIVADLPYVLAEVVYACRREMAANLDDVLERRLHISFEDRSHGRGAAPVVAAIMARELDWDAVETVRQIERYDGLATRNEVRTAALAIAG
jgi:glycerol-3-phosphate dehydrogenase